MIKFRFCLAHPQKNCQMLSVHELQDWCLDLNTQIDRPDGHRITEDAESKVQAWGFSSSSGENKPQLSGLSSRK